MWHRKKKKKKAGHDDHIMTAKVGLARAAEKVLQSGEPVATSAVFHSSLLNP